MVHFVNKLELSDQKYQTNGNIRDKNVGYTHQDSIYLYARFLQENLKQDSLKIFPPKVSRYFCTLFISNLKFEITTATPIYLWGNLITFNLLMQ